MGARATRDPVGDAARQLYGGESLRAFTAERKRLADELRRAGDPVAAAEVARLAKPSVSAWVVNRLWQDARPEFDALLAAGGRLRAGDYAAAAQQRDALTRLRARAEQILRGDGHGATVAVLGRITTTLQALSAIGSWEPDRPGALAADRDPPGFEVLTGVPAPARGALAAAAKKPAPADRRAARERTAQVSAREARQRAAELERLQRTAERLRHAASVRAQAADELRDKLRAAEAELKEAEARAAAADKELARARARR